MRNNRIRVYADTSVYGGVFNEGFDIASGRFFEQVRLARFELVISAIVQAEAAAAPLQVRNLLDDMLRIGRVIDIS
jgi:hypothetical protein